MDAKDIVAKEVARQAEFGYEPSREDFVVAGMGAEKERIRQLVSDKYNGAYPAGYCNAIIEIWEALRGE